MSCGWIWAVIAIVGVLIAGIGVQLLLLWLSTPRKKDYHDL